MTTVRLASKNGVYYGIEMEGHAQYGPSGQDIVCSCLSTWSQLLINTCVRRLEVLKKSKLAYGLKTNQRTGYLEFDVALALAEDVVISHVFTTFREYLESLSYLYPENIELVEVKEG